MMVLQRTAGMLFGGESHFGGIGARPGDCAHPPA